MESTLKHLCLVVLAVLLFAVSAFAQAPIPPVKTKSFLGLTTDNPDVKAYRDKEQAKQDNLFANPKAQCAQVGGTWSDFKRRCDTTGHKHPFSDKKWWAGEVVILGMAAGQGIAVSKVKTGGTWAFGTCGPCTTNRDIALFTGFANVGSFTLEHWAAWYLGHDDTSKGWRTLSYVEVPAIDVAVGVYIQNKYGWGHKGFPVDPKHPCTAEFSQCF